jgi:hypothetical protein
MVKHESTALVEAVAILTLWSWAIAREDDISFAILFSCMKSEKMLLGNESKNTRYSPEKYT